MNHKINQVIKQAFLTFNKSLDRKFYDVHLQTLQSLLKSLTAADVGLSSVNSSSPIRHGNNLRYHAPVSYISIYECDLFTAGIFIIRKGRSIPLHDHPTMTGLCKVLYGSMKIISFDHLPNVQSVVSTEKFEGVAVLQREDTTLDVHSQCEILYPTQGNFHSIHSVDGDCAMFDILAPPYSDNNDCTYYRPLNPSESRNVFKLLGYAQPASDNERFLQRIPQPMDFYCDSIEYSGPQIMTN